MKLGFTGTREGLTQPQRDALQRVLDAYRITEFHHGCCIGADTEAASMVPKRVIWQHPSDRHTCVLTDRFRWRAEPKPPIKRDKDIVKAAEELIACPKGREERHSGTWTTVRYARTKGITITVVWPDGRVTNGNEEEPD